MKTLPVYKQIINDIQGQIFSGELKPGQKLESDGVYAERYNVSRNTVIKAFDTLKINGFVQRFQGGSSYVSSKVNSAQQQNTLSGQEKVISLILPLLAYNMLRSGEYSLVCGVENVLRENKYSLLISSDIEYPDEQISFINSSRQRNSCGTIIYPTIAERSSAVLFNIVLDDFPVVFIDRKIGFKNTPCIQSDNEKGGRLAADHLIERGYRDLFYIADSTLDATQTLRDRFLGFCIELKKYGITIDSSHLIQGFSLENGSYNPTTYETNPELFRNLVTQISSMSKERIGVFACNDAVAYSLICAAADLGISVPDDLGVVGFDDADFSRTTSVPITTIRQDFMKIGQVAAETMISLLNNQPVQTDISIDVELVVRSST